ncbi:MAG: HAD family hydrolase [Spirochaetales bacterium]|nr:HAD family hydrolase [Spirochaetales bacterium]
MGFCAEHGLKALCFDIDGTLYPKWRTSAYLAAAAAAHPLFSMKYNSTRQSLRAQDGLEGKRGLGREDFRRKEASILGYEDIDGYIERYNRCIYEPWQRASRAFIRPYRGMREALLEAKRRGYLIAALSDFPIGNKIELLGLSGLFDYVASTEDSGYLKPNRVPFDVMLESLGTEPGETLYCGDSYRKDVQGARNAGMHTLLLPAGKGSAATYPAADLLLTGWDKFINIVL